MAIELYDTIYSTYTSIYLCTEGDFNYVQTYTQI